MKQTKAVAFCRVSTAEQLLGGSLNRQEKAVLKTAEKLGVVIPKEYWWSGNVSSKRGTNLKRKDINDRTVLNFRLAQIQIYAAEYRRC